MDEDAVELDALERLIRRADGFALAFARVNDLRRRVDLVAELRQRLAGSVHVVHVDAPPETMDLQAFLARAYEVHNGEGEGKLALFVTGLERVLSSVRERSGFLPVLNYKRENLQRTVPVPVVLWLPEFALRQIARSAPDFWAWRSGVFEFTTEPEKTDQIWRELQKGGSTDEYARMTPNERRARIEVLEGLYHDYAERRDVGEPNQAVIQADIASRLARLYQQTADPDAAVEWAEKALTGYESSLGPDAPTTLTIANNLGYLLKVRGDLDGAERLYRRALAGQESLLGPNHPETLRSVNNLGALLYSRGDLDRAEHFHRRALTGRELVLGPDHPATLAAVNNLGHLLQSRGDFAGAEILYRRALTSRETLLGPSHPDTLISVDNMGMLLYLRGDLEGAERFHRRALTGNELSLGLDHPDSLISMHNLGYLLQARGDLDGAESLYRRALAGAERTLGLNHSSTQQYRKRLGILLAERCTLQLPRG